MCEPYGPVHAFRLVHNRGAARVACLIELESPKQQTRARRALGARQLNGAACLDIPVRKDFGGADQGGRRCRSPPRGRAATQLDPVSPLAYAPPSLRAYVGIRPRHPYRGLFLLDQTPMRVLFVTPECAPLDQGRRAGRRERGAAGGAARARRGRATSCCRATRGAREVGERARGRSASASSASTAALLRSGRFAGARLPGALPARRRALPDPAGRTGRTTRCASACCRKRRGCGCRAARLAADVVHCNDWPTALAPVSQRRACRPLLDHPQPRVPGQLRAALARAPGLPPGSTSPSTGSSSTAALSFLKGGLVLRRRAHHGEPDLRARDPDRGARLRPGRAAAPAGAAR